MEITNELVKEFNKMLESKGSIIRCALEKRLSANEGVKNIVKVCTPQDEFIENIQFSIKQRFCEEVRFYFWRKGVEELTFNEDGTEFWSGHFETPKSNPEFGVKIVDIGFLLGAEAQKIDKEITLFVDEISEKHQREIKELQVSPELMEKLKNQERIFQKYFIHFNEAECGRYRTYRPYIQHIPILINKNFENTISLEGIVQMRW